MITSSRPSNPASPRVGQHFDRPTPPRGARALPRHHADTVISKRLQLVGLTWLAITVSMMIWAQTARAEPVATQDPQPKHHAAPPVAPAHLTAMEPLELGRKLAMQRCSNCHALSTEGEKSLAAPLTGLFGRVSGTAEGYVFSPNLKNLAIVWSPRTLSNWLATTTFKTPDIRMRHTGIPDPRSRQALVAYLETLEGNQPKKAE